MFLIYSQTVQLSSEREDLLSSINNLQDDRKISSINLTFNICKWITFALLALFGICLYIFIDLKKDGNTDLDRDKKKYLCSFILVYLICLLMLMIVLIVMVAISTNKATVNNKESIKDSIIEYISNNHSALEEVATIYKNDISLSNLSEDEKTFIKTIVNNLKSIKTELLAMDFDFNGEILDSILQNIQDLDTITSSTYDFTNFNSLMENLENNLKILGNNINFILQEIEKFNENYKSLLGISSSLNNKNDMIDVIYKINQFIVNFQTYINTATTKDSIASDMGSISSDFIDLYRNYRNKTYTTLQDFLDDFNNVVKTNSQDFATILSVYKQFISDGDNTTIPQNIQNLLIAMIEKFHLIGWNYSPSTIDDFITFIKKWESDTTLKAKLINNIFNSLGISLVQAIDQDSQLYDISLKFKNALSNLGLQAPIDVQNTNTQMLQLLPFYQSIETMFSYLNNLDSSSNPLIQAQNQFIVFNTMKTNLINDSLSDNLDNYKNILDGFANILSNNDLIVLTKSSSKFPDFLQAIKFLNINNLIQLFQDFDNSFSGLNSYQIFFDALKNTVNVDTTQVYKGNTFSIPTFNNFKVDHETNISDNSLDEYISFLVNFYNKNKNFLNQANSSLNNLPSVDLSSITSSLYSKISPIATNYNQNLSNNLLTFSSSSTAIQQLQNQYTILLKTLTLLGLILFSINSKEAMVVTTNTQNKTSLGSVAPFWIEGVDSSLYSLNSIGYYPEKSSSGSEDVLMILGGQLQLSILSYLSFSSWFSYPGFISIGLPTPSAIFSPYFYNEIPLATNL